MKIKLSIVSTILLPLLVLLHLVSACGGGTEGTGGVALGGVDTSTRVDRLNPDERQAVCREIILRLKDAFNQRSVCEFFTILELQAHTDQATLELPPPQVEQLCTERSDECMANQPNDNCEAQACAVNDDNFVQQCGASVSQLLACVDDAIRNEQARNELFVCSSAFNYLHGNIPLESPSNTSAECEQAFITCPQLMGFGVSRCGFEAFVGGGRA